jgi:hypothetical protein
VVIHSVLPLRHDVGMYCNETNHLWLGRFAVRLMQLRQDMTLPSAVARAVKAHGYAADIGPERAAELDASVPMWRPRAPTEVPRPR